MFGGATKILRHLRRFRVDVAKLTDEVTHITKFFGDWHLARVYLGARDRFYLDQWRASVEQRLAQLDKLYSVVHAEVNEQRMLWLEIIIVIFFAHGFADSVAGRAVTRPQPGEKRFVTSPIQALTTPLPPNLPCRNSANRNVVQWSSPWS